MERRPASEVRGPEFAVLLAAAAAFSALAAAFPGERPEPAGVCEARIVFDLNRASAEELCLIPGIGPSHAAKIVRYRESGGPFSSPSDLRLVPGLPRSAAAAAERHVSAGPPPAGKDPRR